MIKKVVMWYYGFPLSPHRLRSEMYYLIIYLFRSEKQHIKPPDSDQSDATGKCTLEWTVAGRGGGRLHK